MKIIQLTNSTVKQMMGYVIVADTGEVLVVDGGHNGDETELARVIKSVGGHVDLWLITHPHADHHTAVINLLSDPGEITFDALGSSMLPDSWGAATKVNDMQELFAWNAFAPKIKDKHFEILPGQTFALGSLKIEVLAGANPDLLVNPFNNQSCVFRLTENGFTFLILGDLGVEAGRRLMAAGVDLKADAVQMAHHGQQGVEEAFYQAVAPRIAFWPTPDWLWDNTPYLGGTPGTGPFKTPEVARWMERLGTRNILTFTHTAVFDTADESLSDYS